MLVPDRGSWRYGWPISCLATFSIDLRVHCTIYITCKSLCVSLFQDLVLHSISNYPIVAICHSWQRVQSAGTARCLPLMPSWPRWWLALAQSTPGILWYTEKETISSLIRGMLPSLVSGEQFMLSWLWMCVCVCVCVCVVETREMNLLEFVCT